MIRHDKATTKLKIIFDGSAKVDGLPSLYDCLYVGPSLTLSLLGVLLPFRVNNIAVVADQEKAFLQISLHPEDRDVVRFLCFKNIKDIDFNNFDENEFTEFRFTRILFGLAPSPFLLSATLIKHMTQFIKEDIIFVETLLNSLHVDDVNVGARCVEAGYKFYLKTKRKFLKDGFNLRKFCSYSRVLEQIVTKGLQEDISNEKFILVLQWDKFDISKMCEKILKVLTKRSLIQFIRGIFDPLGLLNRVIAKLKILFQDICYKKLALDDFLSQSYLSVFYDIVNSLREVQKVLFKRVYCIQTIEDPIVSVQVHGFCDASERAYRCCVYLRFLLKSNFVKVVLVSAKSRVSPLRKVTIPRLELLGNLLLSRYRL